MVAALLISLRGLSVALSQEPTRDELMAKAEAVFGPPRNATRLSQEGRVWADKQRKIVIVDGYVTLREGQLEMFACPAGTKEHESIVAVFSAANVVHAGLLAVGAKKGEPTKFEPYKPATGSTIYVHVLWVDEKKKKRVQPAQSWVRDLEKNQEMPFDWVFAGSIFYKDPDTNEESYLGDSGDLICVANFPTATLDIAVESISANSGLVYAAYSDRLPPLFTPVRLVLEVSDQPPRRADQTSPSEKPAARQATPTAPKPVAADYSDLFR